MSPLILANSVDPGGFDQIWFLCKLMMVFAGFTVKLPAAFCLNSGSQSSLSKQPLISDTHDLSSHKQQSLRVQNTTGLIWSLGLVGSMRF